MKSLLSLLTIALFLTSCTTNTTEVNPIKISDLDYMEITLTNNKPWIANIETTEGVSNMLTLVQNFSGDYTLLHSSLELEFQTLFMKCSMTGEAHNQLHNYLIPMVAFFDDIAKDDSEVSAPAISELEIHLRAYSLFFE